MNDLNQVRESENDPLTRYQKFIAIPSWLRALTGIPLGIVVATLLFCLKFPPLGPGYGEGIGWGIIWLMGVVPTGAVIGALGLGLWGIKIY